MLKKFTTPKRFLLAKKLFFLSKTWYNLEIRNSGFLLHPEASNSINHEIFWLRNQNMAKKAVETEPVKKEKSTKA
ncbi:MAG: hypothetical protein FWH27_13605, partial [Planctomycetaceae bacterium]|nr:hypothetical protein [Planctomycetaceae bacterium]